MNSQSEKIPLKEFLQFISRPQPVKSNLEYKILGEKWYAKGLYVKYAKNGVNISAKYMYAVHKGDLVYNRLFAWKGSFAIVPQALDGCYVSNEYMSFIINQQKIRPDYLMLYLSSSEVWNQALNLSQGVSCVSRNRLATDKFLEFTIPYVSLTEQEKRMLHYVKLSSKIQNFIQANSDLRSFCEKLRHAILREAVSGKLVSQDPNNEPASELLKKIKAEKERSLREEKNKKGNALQSIAKEEEPYELPNGWKWVRLGDVTDFKTGKLDSNASVKNGKYPFFTCSKEALQIDAYSYDCEALLLSGNNAQGKYDVKYYNGKFDAYQRTYIISPSVPKTIEFLFLKIFLEHILEELQEKSSGTLTKFLTLKIIRPILFPLPPVAEQKRIVEKVDQLMKYCDMLEQKTLGNQQNSKSLMEAVLKEVFSS